MVRAQWPLGPSSGLSLPRRAGERQRASVLRPADAVWSSCLRCGDHQRGSVRRRHRALSKSTIHFETVDVMRVQNGTTTDYWGVGNLLSLMQQIGGWTPAPG